MAPPNRRRRRSLLHHPRSQFVLALLIVNYLVVYTAALSALALGPTVICLLSDPRALVQDPGQAAAAATELVLFENRVWPFAVLLIILFGVHSIAVSHRIFGPLVQVRELSRRVASGDLTCRAAFRASDDLGDLSESLNRMLAALDHRVAAVQAACDATSEEIIRLHQAQFSTAGDRMEAMADVQRQLAHLQSSLAVFRTKESLAETTHDAAAPGKDACDERSRSPQSAQA
jgi:methyl-accepting chemotaxis protein